MNFLRSVSSVGIFTIISRITGYFRDLLIAHFIGVSAVSDALAFAIKMPSFFRRIFAEGGLHVSFVPVFSRLLKDPTDPTDVKKAFVFANNVMTWLFLTVFLLVVLAEIYFEPLVLLLFPGLLSKKETLHLVLLYGKTIFPFVFFISMTSFYGSLLNSFGKFVLFASSHAMANVFVICYFYFFKNTAIDYGEIFAYAILWGGIFQFLMMVILCRRYRWPLHFVVPSLTADFKKFLLKLGPGMLGIGVVQINLLVGFRFSSSLKVGGMSYLYYADRLNQLPLSIIGVSLSSVLLPLLSHHLKLGDKQRANKIQNNAIRFAVFMMCPFLIVSCGLSLPIVSFLFGTSHLSHYDLTQIAYTIMIYALSVPAYIAIKMMNTRFFAESRTNIPLLGSTVGVITDIFLIYLLIGPLAHLGIALSVSLSAWCQVIFLGFWMFFEKEWRLPKPLQKFLLRIFSAAFASGFLLYLLQKKFFFFFDIGFIKRFFILISLIGVGLSFFIALCFMMKVLSVRTLSLLFKKGFQKSKVVKPDIDL